MYRRRIGATRPVEVRTLGISERDVVLREGREPISHHLFIKNNGKEKR